MKTIISTLIILASVTTLTAQIRTFKWDDMMCSFTGTYDSKRYSEKQLRNTARLITMGEFDIGYFTFVSKYEDIDELDVTKLDEEYKRKSAELRSLELVPGPYWDKVRKRKLKEIDQVYAQRRVKTLAYRDPAVLRAYDGAPECKSKFVEPLIAGGDSLYKVWLDVNIDSRKKNADPEWLRRKFEAEMASPDRDKFAFVEVMAFGWGNCANGLLEYDITGQDGSYLKQFKKLFIRVRETCEEP
jgi:hypothetical protein